MCSAYGSTLSEEAHSQKQLKDMYGMSNHRSSKPELHIVQHRTTMKRAKAVYGGSANDIRHPRGKSSGAQSLSFKRSSFFMAALRHLFFALLLAVCFY
ncbi:hypothetical protein K1719_011736 [Acacia pycnantha]|nr:hypothetical protein K1719_011736 [Acacia pycnantha]